MRAIERAQHYAVMFTAVQDRGREWRSVVPVGAKVDRRADRMTLDGITIARPVADQPWRVVADASGQGG